MKENKNIKDYLHLYLGSPIADSSDGNFIVCDVLDADFLKYLLESPRLKDFRLVLRPLSDMTEEERESQEMVYMRMQEMQDEEGHICDAEIWAETTLWACAKGFDMFQLIEAGLAIDKTTLKENEHEK